MGITQHREIYFFAFVEIFKATLPVIKISGLIPLFIALQNALQGFLILQKRNWFINISTFFGVIISLLITGYLVFTGYSGALAAATGMLAGIITEISLLYTGTRKPEIKV